MEFIEVLTPTVRLFLSKVTPLVLLIVTVKLVLKLAPTLALPPIFKPNQGIPKEGARALLKV